MWYVRLISKNPVSVCLSQLSRTEAQTVLVQTAQGGPQVHSGFPNLFFGLAKVRLLKQGPLVPSLLQGLNLFRMRWEICQGSVSSLLPSPYDPCLRKRPSPSLYRIAQPGYVAGGADTAQTLVGGGVGGFKLLQLLPQNIYVWSLIKQLFTFGSSFWSS